MTPASDDDPEVRDPGLARERTSLAWTRTAISFGALGGVVLKENVITGLIILAIAPLVWALGRISGSGSPGAGSPGAGSPGAGSPGAGSPGAGSPEAGLPAVGVTRIRLITVSIVGVSVLCLVVALLGPAVPGALR